MRRKWILLAAVLAVLAVGGTVLVLWNGSRTPEPAATDPAPVRPGVAPPPAAAHSADALLSPDPRTRQSVLTAELADAVGAIEALPPGSAITLDENGWREHDGFAVATGTVTLPGQPARPVVIGFQREGDQWLVAFEEDA